jgi:ADP-heptose:LPS heptosyltransferase
MGMINLGAGFDDFADTAAVIDQLDLIVSVDTSVVHLAGAMGKKVWVLIPFDPDWRWMREVTQSPWYPTLTLFRQRTPHDWTSAMNTLQNRLSQIVCNVKAKPGH